MGTILVGTILFGIVILILRKMIKDKKSGKTSACGCGCEHCSGHCTH